MSVLFKIFFIEEIRHLFLKLKTQRANMNKKNIGENKINGSTGLTLKYLNIGLELNGANAMIDDLPYSRSTVDQVWVMRV